MKNILGVVFLIFTLLTATPGCVAKDRVEGKVIVIDPGHGGVDPGTVTNHIREEQINLQVALKIRDLLKKKDAKIILTRDGDYSLLNTKVQALELQKRLDVAHNNQADLFISIHVNSVHLDGCCGPEVFYNPQLFGSKSLAESVQKELISIPGAGKRLAKPSDYYVLMNSRNTAILVELGYLSNPDEEKKLMNDGYQKLLAEKIATGIEQYYLANK